MKMANILIALIMVALVLTAAVPAGDLVAQRARKLCINQATGQNVPCPSVSYVHGKYKIKIPGQGEPTMEKVTYFQYLVASPNLKGLFRNWYNSDIMTFYIANYGCMQWYWSVGTWKMPVGCQFRYQY